MNSLKSIKKQSDRNIGIELARIISMLMVVILHIIGHGGILDNTTGLSVNNNLIYLLNIACYGAVDMYAIITGYVCIKSKHRWERIIELWLQVIFYTVGITTILYLIPNNIVNVGIKDLIKSIIPVMSKQYWYFSSYFCLFLFIPFINSLINKISKEEHKKLILISIFTFCGIAFIGRGFGGDIFNINRGYSFLWLTAMYIVGAYIKVYSNDFDRISNKKFLCISLIFTIITWLSEIVISIVTLKIFGKIKGNNLFILYNSPTIFISAVCLFIFFSRLSIKHGVNVILKLAASSFGVYLISEQPFMRKIFITNKFIEFANMPWYLMIISIILTAVVIYLICSIIEYIRKGLFNILHIKELSIKIKKLINKSVISFNNKFKEI